MNTEQAGGGSGSPGGARREERARSGEGGALGVAALASLRGGMQSFDWPDPEPGAHTQRRPRTCSTNCMCKTNFQVSNR